MRQRILAGIILSLTAGAANALTLNAIDRGWYDLGGTHIPDNLNYGVGLDDSHIEYNNFFVFDLSSTNVPFSSATLHLYNTACPNCGFRSLRNRAETYTVFDVSTDINTLTAGLGGISAFMDLGSGTEFGSVVATSASNGTFIDITLNESGLTYLNARLGSRVAFGGAITTLYDEYAYYPQSLFGYTHLSSLSSTQLVGQIIPSPAAVWLLGSALGALGWARRKASTR